eukprot:2215013-Rhodomonas_salina.1
MVCAREDPPPDARYQTGVPKLTKTDFEFLDHLGGASLPPTTEDTPGRQGECRWPNLPDMLLSTLPYS